MQNSATTESGKDISFFKYLKSEFQRGYLLENDEERYTARRAKVYAFFKIPLEIEKFIIYGFLQCADSFFFVITFLPIRFIAALISLVYRSLKKVFGYHKELGLLTPAEKVDLLKGFILIVCFYVVSFIDTSVYYHIIKTQSTIKMYLFFNMLEIADRLMSAFGQDTLDALFWTATEPSDPKRSKKRISLHLFHLIVTPIYVILHSVIVLLQALTLNVAINSDNKALLTIVISNNFVELKGAVFKKFDRTNLLQIACSDVRERFHYCVLLFVVVIQTMKEYAWKEDRLYILLPDCSLIFWTEVLIDWVKHAFVTRFNDIPIGAYRDYNILIASDLIVCKQKHAYTDHSDLVSRRMGFIPLPLAVVIFRVLSQAVSFNNPMAYLVFILGFLCVFTTRILIGIGILGKACDLVESAEFPRSRNVSESIESSTPKLNRRRTISKELRERMDSHKTLGPVLESLKMKDKQNKKDTLHPTTAVGTEDTATYYELNVSDQSSTTQDNETQVDPPSLDFLTDSRNGLMTNSMVNISILGLEGEDFTDGDLSSTQTAQDTSTSDSESLKVPSSATMSGSVSSRTSPAMSGSWSSRTSLAVSDSELLGVSQIEEIGSPNVLTSPDYSVTAKSTVLPLSRSEEDIFSDAGFDKSNLASSEKALSSPDFSNL